MSHSVNRLDIAFLAGFDQVNQPVFENLTVELLNADKSLEGVSIFKQKGLWSTQSTFQSGSNKLKKFLMMHAMRLMNPCGCMGMYTMTRMEKHH